MNRPSRSSKIASNLSESLQHVLNSYALAASAAGVALLALAQPAEAKVIYTKTHQVIGWNGVYSLDLNHDGTVDFLIQESGSRNSLYFNNLSAQPALGNAVVSNDSRFAAALNRGAQIGPKQRFFHGNYPQMVDINHGTATGGGTYGPWINVTNRYLGLKFKIRGRTQYGWARLSVKLQPPLQITATLTGYAYETIAKKPIRAGQTDDASLGKLALGAQGLAVGRRP